MYVIKCKYTNVSNMTELPFVYDTLEDAIIGLERMITETNNRYNIDWFIFDSNDNQVEFKFPFEKGCYDIDVLEGLTILDVNVSHEKNEIKFVTDKGTFLMYHSQECCEDVYIEDICGDLGDLLGTPCLSAYSTSNNNGDEDGIEQWTFYHIRTIKGTVTLRWYGSSNGYYSVGVDFAYI